MSMRLWALLTILLATARADTVTLGAGSQTVAVAPDGSLAITSDATKTTSFERLYAGNGYFYLRVNGTAFVATNSQSGTLAARVATTAAAEQFQASAAASGSFLLTVRSTGAYVAIAGSSVVANSPAAAATAFSIASTPDATPSAEVDFSNPRQQIAGFGAADAFYSGWLTAHPNKEQIYRLLFGRENLGASILRVQNIWGQQQTTSSVFDPDTAEVVAKANIYRGSPITVLMSSWSPPATLKASGEVSCHGAPVEPGCTLRKVNGGFDYTGFAQYWFDSLNAYASLGVVPDYISLQNEPDFTPPGYGGCRFDPADTPGGMYAGYKQALNAVYAKLQDLPKRPAIVGPEVVGLTYNTIENFLAALTASDLQQLAAVAHHLYGAGDTAAPDTFNGPMLQLTRAASSRQLWETEYDHSADQTNAMQTAWLIHNAMATEEASAYLYWSYFWPDNNQLVSIDNPWTQSSWTYPGGFHINDYYYAMQHFSRFVQPGFQRFASPTGLSQLRATAYYNAQERRLVFVLVNTSSTETLTPTLVVPSELPGTSFPFGAPAWTQHMGSGVNRRTLAATVYRSTFSGSPERFAYLGQLPAGNIVTLPPAAVATIVVDEVYPVCRPAFRVCDAIRGPLK